MTVLYTSKYMTKTRIIVAYVFVKIYEYFKQGFPEWRIFIF